MLISSTQKFIRVSPRKLQLVARPLIGLPIDDAVRRLTFADKTAAFPLIKAIKTAMGNAVSTHKAEVSGLTLASIQINAGTVIKRGLPVSRGQYHRIKKRTSHITVVLKTNLN